MNEVTVTIEGIEYKAYYEVCDEQSFMIYLPDGTSQEKPIRGSNVDTDAKHTLTMYGMPTPCTKQVKNQSIIDPASPR